MLDGIEATIFIFPEELRFRDDEPPALKALFPLNETCSSRCRVCYCNNAHGIHAGLKTHFQEQQLQPTLLTGSSNSMKVIP